MIRISRISLFTTAAVLALGPVLGCHTAQVNSPESSLARGIASKEAIDAVEYEKALSERIQRIPEFREIREWARKRGVRIWLGGGSATGIASYLREELSTTSQEVRARFGYSYYDVYRSTQDADIILDGNGQLADELEQFLKSEFEYLQGSKSIWEVRLLRESRGSGVGKKDPIIGSADFRNQNSDSYSTALVELTDPPAGELRVRDAFEWNHKGITTFFSDLLDRKITFYRNPLHSKTSRAISGWNPEIISVIRAFTKAYQYDAEIPEDALALMMQIIAEFDARARLDPMAVRYILANANKLFQHSRDIEATWNALEDSGLRRKLVDFSSRHGDHALATLLNREPLRSYPFGETPPAARTRGLRAGKKAKDLGLGNAIFSHETSSLLAYENITMSRSGKPNFFISRQNAAGEVAVHGDGLYGRKGRTGAAGTKLTIRFELNPEAVEGRDFYNPSGDYFVFLNANAIRVLPEDRISLSLQEFMKILDSGSYSANDLGVLHMLEQKMVSTVANLSADEVDAIYKPFRGRLADEVFMDDRHRSASFEFLLRISKSEPRLNSLFFSEIVGATQIAPLARYNALERYGMRKLLFSERFVKEAFWGALALQSIDVFRGNFSPEELQVWHRTYVKAVGEDSERALKILDNAKKGLMDGKVSWIYSQLNRLGMGEIVEQYAIQELKANVRNNMGFFYVFNCYALRQTSLSDDLRGFAVSRFNPLKSFWESAFKDLKNHSAKFDLLIRTRVLDEEAMMDEWSLIRGYYETVHASAPAEAEISLKTYLQRQRGESFTKVARDLIEVPEFQDFVGEQVIRKLETSSFFLEKSEIVAPYFDLLNSYLTKKGDVPGSMKKWAQHPLNPQHLKWTKVKAPSPSTKVVKKIDVLRKSCAEFGTYTTIKQWVSLYWQPVFGPAFAESPGAAKDLSLEILQRLRGSDFQFFAKELQKVGFGDEVATLAVAKIATNDLLVKIHAKGTTVESKTIYYGVLNDQLSTLGSLPKKYAKYALAADNPLAKQWGALSIDRRSSCLNLLRGFL